MDIIKKQFFESPKSEWKLKGGIRRDERAHYPALHHLSGLISSLQLEGAPVLSPHLLRRWEDTAIAGM